MAIQKEHYTLSYDPTKNRIYIKSVGFWKDTSIADQFLADFNNVLSSAKGNFTLVSDNRQLKVMPQEVGSKLHEVQQIAINKGLRKSAIVTSEDITANMQIRRVSRQNSIDEGYFNTIEEAEGWLDK